MDKFYLVSIFIVCFLVLRDLYPIMFRGKLIIKKDESRGYYIIWLIILIILSIFLLLNIREYIYNKNLSSNNAYYIDNILSDIFWVLFSFSNTIRSFTGSEIRENGLYISSDFYKWSKIKSYKWISSNTIQFRVNRLFKINKSIEFTIKEELKSKVEDAIQMHIH